MASSRPHIYAFFRAVCLLAFATVSISAASAQTLEQVRKRGYLICAASQPQPGFAQKSAEGFWSGFDVDFCRAVSAAVFGDPGKVEFRPLGGNARFAQLQVGEVDVVARNAPWTMWRDISYQANYVGTSFFDGQTFIVRQSVGVVSAYELADLSVCVTAGGDDQNNLADFFFENQIEYTEVLYEDRTDLLVAYRSGLCDAVSAPASWLYAIMRNLSDPAVHRILPERISKSPLGPVVREGDDEWFNIVKWVLYAQLNAEELGVNSLNLESMAAVKTPAIRRFLGLESDFGKAIGLEPDWMQSVIGSVGNYGEMYDRNFGPQTGAELLRGPNALWTQGGLLFAPPIR